MRSFAKNDSRFRIFNDVQISADMDCVLTGHGSHSLARECAAYCVAIVCAGSGRGHSAGETADPSAASGTAEEVSRHTRSRLA